MVGGLRACRERPELDMAGALGCGFNHTCITTPRRPNIYSIVGNLNQLNPSIL